MSGTLYLIPTPLLDPKSGSMDEAALHASQPPGVREQIAALHVFAVENAKAARAFLKVSGTTLPLQELAIHEIGHEPDAARVQPLLAALKAGRDVGVLAEAGCPGIADPGAQLAALAYANGIRVAPLVGASSLLLALMASGLNGQSFAFHGYLPVKPEERSRRIKELEQRSAREAAAQLFIETPYRNEALFATLLASLKAETRLCIAADLTLKTEFVQTRKIKDWRGFSGTTLSKRPSLFILQA